MMRPDVIRENALSRAEKLHELLVDPVSIDERERLLFDLSGCLHVAGIATLLATANARAFRDHLARAGELRCELLRIGAHGGRGPGRFQRASVLFPFLDAVLAGADAVAADIARLSPDAWMEDEEYEEDFWYARFLHAFLLEASGPGAARAVEELRRASGENTPRCGVAAALLARDAKVFERALWALVAERSAEIRELEEGLLRDAERHYVDKHVFVEGLALLWLARSRGLDLEPPSSMLPVLARRQIQAG